MAFSGLTFPTLVYGNRFRGTKPGMLLPVAVTANGGYEYRTLRFGYARRTWSIPSRLLAPQDMQTLAAFYAQLGGMLQSFLFVDPEHNQLDAFSLGAGTQLSVPATPTASGTTGTLAAGTYSYAVTATNAQGETIASAPASFTLSATGGVALAWTAVPGASGYNVYGRSGTLGLLGSTSGTSFTDSGSVTPGVASPSVNGTGTLSYPVLVNLDGLAHPLFHLTGVTVSPSNGTLSIVNGQPVLTFPAGSAPVYGTNVTLTGTFGLAARFDMSMAWVLQNAVNPLDAGMQVDAIKLIEVFE